MELHLRSFLAAALSIGCQLDKPDECERASECDYGEHCSDRVCRSTTRCGCREAEHCVEVGGGAVDCLSRDGACDSHQDCMAGAVCHEGMCSLRRAQASGAAREAFDAQVFGLVDQEGPADALAGDTESLFVAWTPPGWLDADRTTVGVFREPPLVIGNRIVNDGPRALAGLFSFEGSGSHRLRLREVLAVPLADPIPAGPYYWAVWQHDDGEIQVFSDVGRFQVERPDTPLLDVGAACTTDVECWSPGGDPVACIDAECQFACAGWDGDCERARCRLTAEAPPWECRRPGE